MGKQKLVYINAYHNITKQIKKNDKISPSEIVQHHIKNEKRMYV